MPFGAGGDFDVGHCAGHNGYRVAQPFHQGRFIGAADAVPQGGGQGFQQYGAGKHLRCLGQPDFVAGQGRADFSGAGGHSLDRIGGRYSYDGPAVGFFAAGDGGGNHFRSDKRPAGIVDQNYFIGRIGGLQTVANRILTAFPAGHHPDPVAQLAFGNLLLQPGYPVRWRGNDYLRDAGMAQKWLEGIKQQGLAGNFQELFGGITTEARPASGGRYNYAD